MKNSISKRPIGRFIPIIRTKSKKIRVSILIFTSFFLFSSIPYFFGPGLLQPQAIGQYANDIFPGTPNFDAPYRVAFPNLTFFYPIAFKPVPNQNKIILGQLNGVIYWFEDDETTLDKNLLLDLSGEVGLVSDGGFLGLTIHPEFDAAQNPKNYVYVYYATKNAAGEDSPGFGQYTSQGCTFGADEHEGNFLILERFEVNPLDMTFVENSRTSILKNRMYGTTHYGGGLDFGNDGFLYLTTGDQASWQSSQDYINNLDGGVLRLDVDKDPARSHEPIRKKPDNAGEADEITGIEYWIPNDNPFLSPDGSHFEEYYSVGLRNPFRMTKDSETGDFYIGDVGLATQEEINVLEVGTNYGWPIFEGFGPGPGCLPDLLNNMTHKEPLVAFDRITANSITGGYVYRGSDIPELYGKYLCADYGEGEEIFAVDIETGTYEQIGTFLPQDIISFGQDVAGELYLLRLGQNTNIYKLQPNQVDYSALPQLLSETGVFSDLSALEVIDGIIPYELHESFWSDGALKRRWMAIPNNGTHNTPEERINYSENGDWEFPVGSVLIKHFDVPTDDNDPSITRKIETRFSIVAENGEMYFLTYNWNEDETDAVLQTASLDEPIDIITDTGGTRTQIWHYPSNSECITCHNSANKGSLGLRTRYLNNDYTYDATSLTGNQLVTLSHLGIIEETITDADTPNLLTSKSIYDSNATIDEKARSYMDLNCAYCHRADNNNRAAFDLRLFNSLEATELLTAGILSPLPNLDADQEIVFPGDASKSILYHRMNSVDPSVMMPPLAKSIVDQDAVDLIEAWINQLEAPATSLNAPDELINLALLPSASVTGSVSGGRGTPLDILYDPRINDYYVTTTHNEYGIPFNANLGTITLDDPFEWRVDWRSLKNINYITIGGVFSNQPQPNSLWRISYLNNGVWSTIEEGQGGWLNAGIYEWGGAGQAPIQAEALRVQVYSDGTNDIISIHLRGRGGISTASGDDSATTPKATLIQYLPSASNCAITSIAAGVQTNCVLQDNTYTQEVTVEYAEAPETGTLNVNGQEFPITASPQTVTLTDLNSDGLDVNVMAFFTAEPTCTFMFNNLFTAPSGCNVSELPSNSPDATINLGLIPEAVLSGSAINGRGNPRDILFDPNPTVFNYAQVTTYNEYGILFGTSLGDPQDDNRFEWMVNWPEPQYVNYLTIGGVYPNQPQPNSMWSVSYKHDEEWTVLDSGQGGWLNAGIFEWGGDNQTPIIAEAIKVEVYSDGTNEVLNIHLRGRGGISSNQNGDDSATTTKATLIQYIPLNPETCGLSITTGAYLFCGDTWKDGIAPDNTTDAIDVYIGNGTYVINEDENIRVNNLNISVGAKLIIREGASIWVNGDLINSGVIDLLSTSTKFSSIIVEGTSNTSVNYKRHINAFSSNDLIASPVQGLTFESFEVKNPNLFENPGNTSQKLFGPFNEVTGVYELYSTTTNASTELAMAKGYRTARDASEDGTSGTTFTFTGNLETNDVPINITSSGSSFNGWNLIGNPYASYISFDTFFELNKDELDDSSYQAVYGYSGNPNNSWEILNNLTTNRLIAPGQGFFVKSKVAGGIITFTPGMRAPGNSNDFILERTTSNHLGYLKLNASADQMSFSTEFYFNRNATLGLDSGYDASLFGGAIPTFAIYSQLVQNNMGVPYAIQALGESAMQNAVVPLGVHANQGQNISFSIEDEDISDSINIYLEDRETNIFTLLNDNSYSIVADANFSGTGRFFIRFESNSVLSTNDEVLSALKIFYSNSDKTVNIIGVLESETNVILYDLHGRVIKSTSLGNSNNRHAIDVSELSTGMYIAELTDTSNKKRLQKLVIR